MQHNGTYIIVFPGHSTTTPYQASHSTPSSIFSTCTSCMFYYLMHITSCYRYWHMYRCRYLNNNAITFLEPVTFAKITSVIYMYVVYAKLQEQWYRFHCTSNLSGNQLASLSVNLFQSNAYLKVLCVLTCFFTFLPIYNVLLGTSARIN